MIKKQGIFILILLITLTLGTPSVGVATNQLEEKEVLYISSYGPTFLTFYQQVDGIREVLEPQGVVVDIEFMDTKRYFSDEAINLFHQTLTYKMEHRGSYDGIIIADDNALDYYMTKGKDLFGQTPMVFMGINDIQAAKEVSTEDYISGVVENVSIKETIDLALLLQDKASRVIALTDTTASGKGDEERYLRLQKNYSLPLTVLSTSGYSFDQYKDQLASIDESSIVLLLSVFSDESQKRISFSEGLDMVVTHTPAPVYHPYAHGIGQGLLGGKVVSHYEQGKAAATMMKNVLLGIDHISGVEYQPSPNIYLFDKAVMDQYGLDLAKLPTGTTLLNQKKSLLEENMEIVLIILSIIVIEGVSILVLVRVLNHKHHHEIQLKKRQGALEDERSKLLDSNNLLVATNEEINQQLFVDAMTGLKNRSALNILLEQYMKEQENFSLVFMDIDNFKSINDVHGHEFGDQVINYVSQELTRLESASLDIGRFSGDEFLMIIRDNHREVDRLLHQMYAVFNGVASIQNKKTHITFSMGIATFPQHGENVNDLVKRADLALYEAKHQGKNTFVYFDQTMNDHFIRKMEAFEAIRGVVQRQELALVYQPLVDAHTEQIMSFEALLRWKNEDFKDIHPGLLIEYAEEIGMIIDIGEWVMKEAFTFTVALNLKHQKDYQVAINLSVIQLRDNDFIQKVNSLVSETGVNPRHICFELTESTMITSYPTVQQSLSDLTALGFTIALDDFGTGYSSLGHLRELSASVLKIDKSFVDEVAKDPYHKDVVKAIVDVAKCAEMVVVAEGVETIDQYHTLKAMDCDKIQGYYFYRPLDEEGISTLLS